MCIKNKYFSMAQVFSWKNFERYFKGVLIVLTILVIILITVIVILTNEKDKCNSLLIQNAAQCLTPACIETAYHFVNNMDPSTDPCDDFYQFACGNFMKHTDIPNDQPSVSSILDVQNKGYQRLRAILEEPPQFSEPRAFSLMKIFYNICINDTAIEEDGLTTIKTIIEGLGGWPILTEEWYDEKFDWKQLMHQTRLLGYHANYFLTIDVIPDPKNSTKRIISLDEADLELSREILVKGLENDMVQLYHNYMVDIAVLFGVNKSFAAEELKKSLELEIELARISLSLQQRQNQNALYHPITMTELQRRYSDIDWKMYIKYFLNIPKFKLSHDDVVILRTPNYLNDLEGLLRSTSKRVQANYIIWRIISTSVPYLNTDLRNRRLEFLKHLNGETEMLPFWKECTQETLRNFWNPLSILYERKYLNEDAKTIIIEMLAHIEKAFIKMLHDIDWMDEETKRKAQKKGKLMPISTGFGNEARHEILTEDYSSLNFTSTSYLMAILTLSIFRGNIHFSKLEQPFNNSQIYQDISIAYKIDIPLGLFQGIFFNTDRPLYVNYGAVGTMIAHLITHVFGNQGKETDEYGNLAEWWSENTKRAFNEKAQCIVGQYGNFTIPTLATNVNGERTQDENIADNAGIKAAYLAYNEIEQVGLEKRLPGLNYTAAQMFWISTANVWCEKYRPEDLKYFLLTSLFSPSNIRVIGSLTNSEYFARDFNCPLGSKMNPKVKCQVW